MELTAALVPLLRNGTTESVQRLAYAHIGRDPKSRVGLTVALAGTTNLAEDIADALETHVDPEVRSALWIRDGADQQKLLARLGRETSGQVVAAMIGSATDQDAVADVLRRHMKMPQAKGVMYQKAWHLPADVVAAAMAKVGRGNDRTISDLLECETSLAALVQHPDAHPLLRLAACAIKATPADVVTEHLATLIDRAVNMMGNRQDRQDLSAIMLRLSFRPPSLVVLAAVRSQAETLARWNLEKILDRYAGWENEVARMAHIDGVGDALRRCATAADVNALWAALTFEAQKAAAPEFAATELCDATLMRQLCQHADPEALLNQPEYCNPLWARQEKDLFQARARRKPRTVYGAITAATSSTDSADPATLIGWALDIQSELTLEWGNLLTHPAFPQERYAELPLGVLVFALQQCQDDEIAWVADAISNGLTQQSTGREPEWAVVLDRTTTMDGSFQRLLDATTAILA